MTITKENADQVIELIQALKDEELEYIINDITNKKTTYKQIETIEGTDNLFNLRRRPKKVTRPMTENEFIGWLATKGKDRGVMMRLKGNKYWQNPKNHLTYYNVSDIEWAILDEDGNMVEGPFEFTKEVVE